MHRSLNLILLFLDWCISFPTVSAQYCEWGLCSSVEYCCGYNTCCAVSYPLYLVAGLFGGIVAIGILSSFLYLRKREILFYIQQKRSTEVKYTQDVA